ncbi:MAG: HAD-IC family P-type ATPase [Streptosporangiales bacterium]|nr:HAD-IC family P-type ATPase [Streptosporangiales bacterium]
MATNVSDIPTTDLTQGLTQQQAAARLHEYGPNAVPEPRPPHLGRRIVAQLRDPLVMVLLAAVVVTVALRDYSDAIVIILVVVLNTTVGLVQEVRADHAVAALRRLTAPTAQVMRDGRRSTVDVGTLVPGDVVLLAAGDIVPADVRLVEVASLRVDEAALTGESMPVDKYLSDGDQGEVLAGTVVTGGRGRGVVTRTGLDSALGKIVALVAGQPRQATPLQRRLAGLGRTLGVAAVALSGLVLVAGLVRGLPLADMILTAVSLVVAAVPESLPAVVTVTLALGAHRMARRAAIVRRLPAVETLGSVTVIAADKTGTLTEGSMRCELVAAGDDLVDVTSTHRALRASEAVRAVARDFALCNDASWSGQDGASSTDDPVEVALVAAAQDLGVGPDVRERHPRVLEIPFDADRRRMTTVHRAPDGSYLAMSKGAPEVLLADETASPSLTRTAERLTRAGYRVLAIAEARWETRPPDDELETGLTPVGLVALTDPVRTTAPEVVRRFRRAGIRMVLITGDHPATAAAVAERVGFARPAEIATGADLAAGTVRAEDVTVFARTRPEQKMDIVHALKRHGEVVAMTGDGVNDAPALRAANIGVAMGRGGTEVARQSADLVLADDELATVGVAIEEGRRIYANIRRFLVYAMSGGAAEILVMLVGPFLGMTVPLLPAQILWVNMLTHGLPGVALGAEPAERGLLDVPPQRPGKAVLDRRLAGRVMAIAVLITAACLGTAAWAASTGRPWQTMLFVVLGVAQLGVALSVRARPAAGTRRNRSLLIAVTSSFVLQLAAVTIGPLRDLLGTGPLSPRDFGICLAVAVVPGLVLATIRALTAGRPHRRGPTPLPTRHATGPQWDQSARKKGHS